MAVNGGLISSMPGPFRRKLKCPCCMAVSFSQASGLRMRANRSHKSLPSLVSEAAHCHGHLLKTGMRKNLWTFKLTTLPEGLAGGSGDPRHGSLSALQKFASAWGNNTCSDIGPKDQDIHGKQSEWTTEESSSEQVADPGYWHRPTRS